ncbi:MAG: cupin domain-containing protein, partial [Nitrospirota bacterium]
KKTFVEDKSRLYKYKGNFVWQGIKTERYKSGSEGWTDVLRKTLIGNHGETSKFHVRYFEILPCGHTSFEVHKHEHVVVGIRGRGKVLCGNRTYEMSFLDTLYIAPYVSHQLRNPYEEPFGFFCIVNARRDKPRMLLER